MKRNIVVEIICLLFILLFAYAAVSKLLHYSQFKNELGRSPLLAVFAGWVAIGIPFLEIILSLLLMFTKFRIISLYSSFGLMVLFSLYIIAITKFADYVPCSCGGVLARLNWNQHLIFNSVFILLSVVGVLLSPNSRARVSED
ncbi:MauE/DoxX family redox-associated membrane protein [Pedobacter heparinus]|uniref:MauE/DoxX family redox-associated membrane protein n=1 Tax=Pedobacter heparinus TaxID=984 RepID=UPI00292F9C7B|nr:MauE/DoxX family redox-associated membrane protein [Pedobacter heparinus]